MSRPRELFLEANLGRPDGDPMWNPFSTPAPEGRTVEEANEASGNIHSAPHTVPAVGAAYNTWQSSMDDAILPKSCSWHSSPSRRLDAISNASGSPGTSLRQQMSSTLRQESSLLPIALNTFRSSSSEAREVWAWLEGTDAGMPNAMIGGNGLAIGSSYAGFQAPRHAHETTLSGSRQSLQDSSPSRRLAEVKARSLRFLEVKDGRISRLHCMISNDYPGGAPWLSLTSSIATIEDLSMNGTFLNGQRLRKGEKAPLNDGDKISLVLSLSPMIERAVIFRAGDPAEYEQPADWVWTNTLKTKRRHLPEGHESQTQPSAELEPDVYQRTTTSLYTTAESSNAGDLICQICLGPFRNCVAIQPCGHSFCAACLSHHFAAVLQDGQPLNCPLRCLAPQRVVINFAMRQLIRMRNIQQDSVLEGDSQRAAALQTVPYSDLLAQATLATRPSATGSLENFPSNMTEVLSGSRSASQHHSNADSDDEDGFGAEDGLNQMSATCPIWDSMLPLDASQLKSKQVEHAIEALRTDHVESLLTGLERLARLAWNDDEVRGAVLAAGGVEVLLGLMKLWLADPAVLCNACLCLMSLVRGEGPQSEATQWKVMDAQGVQGLVSAAVAFPDNAAVQLSVLLCIIPLSLDNSTIQIHVAEQVLCHVMNALRLHINHADVQAKGLVVLGVLGQGDGQEHDQIRQQQLSLGVTARISAALEHWGVRHEEILWSVLFSLAVLVKDGNDPYQPAIRAVAAAGIPKLLEQALDAYKANEEDAADEMILSAGAYMLSTLQPAATQISSQPSEVAWALSPILQPTTIWPWGLR